MWNLWIGPTERGGNGSLPDAISRFNERRYNGIRYLLIVQKKITVKLLLVFMAF